MGLIEIRTGPREPQVIGVDEVVVISIGGIRHGVAVSISQGELRSRCRPPRRNLQWVIARIGLRLDKCDVRVALVYAIRIGRVAAAGHRKILSRLSRQGLPVHHSRNAGGPGASYGAADTV